MIARCRSLLFAAVLSAGCNEPTGVFRSPPTELASARGGGSGITSVLLPTLGGAFAEARAVNDAGVVVGSSTDITGIRFAVRWTRNSSGWTITRIPYPGSEAFAVNANGAAVGVRGGGAKLWPAAGGEIDLGPGVPNGINSAETIVGTRVDGSQRAVFWRKPSGGWSTLPAGNASLDFPAFPGGTGAGAAKAINDAGVVAGLVVVSTATSAQYAVRWNPVGEGWAEPIALPGTESSFATAGRAINDNADIAGHLKACQSCSSFGIFWPNGSSGTSLESFFGNGSGWVEGINNDRRVVGYRFDIRRGQRAFTWLQGGTSREDLSGPGGYSGTWAYDINNQRPAQAVGYGYGPNPSNTRAIVWSIPSL